MLNTTPGKKRTVELVSEVHEKAPNDLIKTTTKKLETVIIHRTIAQMEAEQVRSEADTAKVVAEVTTAKAAK